MYSHIIRSVSIKLLHLTMILKSARDCQKALVSCVLTAKEGQWSHLRPRHTALRADSDLPMGFFLRSLELCLLRVLPPFIYV